MYDQVSSQVIYFSFFQLVNEENRQILLLIRQNKILHLDWQINQFFQWLDKAYII